MIILRGSIEIFIHTHDVLPIEGVHSRRKSHRCSTDEFSTQLKHRKSSRYFADGGFNISATIESVSMKDMAEQVSLRWINSASVIASYIGACQKWDDDLVNDLNDPLKVGDRVLTSQSEPILLLRSRRDNDKDEYKELVFNLQRTKSLGMLVEGGPSLQQLRCSSNN
ncbi:hypothetical protein M758_9G046500 [Ceratodon purpureus]|uniref:Uncharacterized protein n=1 Tax=Ceratodon purpureus TaxID=3225 RepID=A0A8T0GNS6_CERPU|nr:hypothetical protein KC19_9G047300 [Ceratodon purpureus]KAG0605294.1 hypothetical protein M758_9G046500 [Ceratodon purpureus]